MKTLAFIFCYNRPDVLARCVKSVFEASDFVPDEVVLIDDGSTDKGVLPVLLGAAEQYRDKAKVTLWLKARNEGFSDSAVRALAYARHVNPEYLFFIESDYVYAKHGLDVVMDCFENTAEGLNCFGIVGYDHPNFRHPYFTENIFPSCMKAQVGEDNVNRAALHKPKVTQGKRFRFQTELVSNTCWTCYLNWRRITNTAEAYPEFSNLLDQACTPRENPNYPDSGKYKAQRTVDDGMLSHAVSLFWNRVIVEGAWSPPLWPQHRDRFAAWVNIRPSVAEHVFAGGMHA